MNVDLHDLLAGRAESVEPPVLDPLAVVARGERLVRRRHRLTAAGAVLALAFAIGTTTLVLGQGGDRAAPVDDPSPPATGSRPLSYGQGQVIHLGDRQVDTGLNYLSLDITDDGAAFTTLDGGIWFTDGTGIEQIGATLAGTVEDKGGVSWVAARPRDWVVNDSAGSLLAWLEYPTRKPGQPELVVYDSARRTVVQRRPVDLSVQSDTARVVAVAGREVFLADIRGIGVQSLLRYRVDSGTLEPVTPVVFEAARRGVPRALVVGASAQEGELMLHMGGFPDGFPGWLVVRDSRLDGLFDPHTGDRLDVRVPSRYEIRRLYFVQWLDNDRFTLISDAEADNKAPIGDLLTCRIAAGRCTVTIEAGWDRGLAPPLLPGHGGIGADLALIHASAEAAG